MSERKNLILDIDGTLLFGEYVPGALVIKGRRRDSYLAAETLTLLNALQSTCNILLATGRSLHSVQAISELLAGKDIRLSGIAAENGGIWLDSKGTVHHLVSRSWLEVTGEALLHMGSTAQAEFVTCLALLSPKEEELHAALRIYKESNCSYHIFEDGNKTFILAGNVHKKNALIYGLGADKLNHSMGVGNDRNDTGWLESICFPACTGCSKQEVKALVIKKKGTVSQEKSHAGIQEILRSFLTGPSLP